jgi:cell wall-associated NlpC family hydrolase
MERALVALPLLPVRSEPSERSEMVTQLLFGECVEVLETRDGWARICNQTDGYQGWATARMLTELTEEMGEFLLRYPTRVLSDPLTPCRLLGQKEARLYLPASSVLYASRDDADTYFFPSKTPEGYDLYDFKPLSGTGSTVAVEGHSFPQRLLDTAARFLNAPYLWGGKTLMGMDCSALVQVSASVNGCRLPRDAKDQARQGVEIDFEVAAEGDLAFFANPEGRIVHVGVVAGSNRILHASASVRYDRLDEQGIFHEGLGIYTHILHSLRRLDPLSL